MRTRMKAATLLLAWLIIIPIGVIVPSSVADAASAPNDDLFGELNELTTQTEPGVDIEFGQRLSLGSAHAAAAGAAALPTESMLPRPDFRIWPHEDLNQLVNLDSFLMITDGFESKSWCWCFWFFNAYFDATPYGASFEFRETDTGATTKETCWGPGAPWFPGQEDSTSFPFCGKEWDHSSDVTGAVEAKARVEHIIVVTGDIFLIYPAQSRASDTKTLKVGEVQSVGLTIALPVVDAPSGSDSGGFCSKWGISVVCWLGEQAVDAAIDAILLAAPFLNEVKNFFEGCGDAALDAVGGLVDILRELKEAITNPQQFISEKLEEFRDLIEAIREDPVAFATEVLGDLAQLDVLENEGVAVWLGKITCTLAIEYFTGKAADAVIGAARTWLRNRRNNPDGPDGPDGDGPDGTNCVLSSFPGQTLVLMADGTHERIDAIRPGDWVMSHNIDTSVWEPGLVVDQWSHLDRGPPATATLTDHSTITATDDHNFWLANTGEWVELQHVQAGDNFLTPTGQVTVADVAVGQAQDWTVWELTVVDNHNFTVRAGDSNLLVHNAKPPCSQQEIDDIRENHGPNEDPVDTTNLDRYDGDGKPDYARNADGEWVGGWEQAPNPNNPDYNVYEHPDGGLVFEKEVTLPDGTVDTVAVRYNEQGYPDFTPHAVAQVDIGEFNNRPADFRAANEAIGHPEWGNSPPEGYVWHHVESPGGGGGTMELVPAGVHNTASGGFPHAGGISTNGGG